MVANGCDFLGVNSKFQESFAPCLSMGLGGLSVPASVVVLPVNLFLISLVATSWGQPDGLDEDIGGSPHLFHRQQLAADDVFVGESCWRTRAQNSWLKMVT